MNHLSPASERPELKNYTLTPVDFDPFSGPEIESFIPVTASQSEIWLACAFGDDDAERSFNDSLSIRFTGYLDTINLEKSLSYLVERHESLRATFSPDGKVMYIHKYFPFSIEYGDLSVGNSNPEEVLHENIRAIAFRKFDLQSGPLFRTSLYKLSDTEHHLVINTHHIICDGWSTGVIIQDLSILYSAFVQNKIADIIPAGSFHEFAMKQDLIASCKSDLQNLRFWTDQFKTDIPVSKLPTDFPRPASRTFKSECVEHKFDKDLVTAVQNTGAKAGASLITTIMSAFEILLSKLSGEQQIVLGVPTSSQSATGNCRLVGHCVNLLPVLSTIIPNQSFSKYLKERKAYILDALDNRQVTFVSILNEIKLARDVSRTPLVQVVYNAHVPLSKDIKFHGLEFFPISNPKAFENFEIFLDINREGHSINIVCTFNTRLFKTETISKWLNDLELILRQVVQNQDVLVADITITDTLRKECMPEVIHNSDKGFMNFPVHEMITAQSKLLRQKTAILFGDRRYSYTELEEKSDQFAGFLSKHNVQRGDLVGLCVDRSPEMIFALIGILKCGAAYIPLDPSYPKERIIYMLEDSGTAFLVTSMDKRDESVAGQLTCLFIEEAFQDNQLRPDLPTIKSHHSDLAYILYTSGSTGRPKGVQISHGNLSNFLLSMQREPGLTISDCLLAITTISFDIAGLELYLPLITGAQLVLVDSDTSRDGGLLLDIMVNKNITFMQATPATWRMMLDSGWQNKLPIKMLCGGESLPKELAHQLLDKGSELWNMYGPTETTVWSTLKKISFTDRQITIGKPIANTSVYILDVELQPIGPLITGEIFIGGDGVAKGYQNKKTLTDERFLPDPFSPGQRMYKTGDLGKISHDGEIVCLGRTDSQVKIRGFRIELGEIEMILQNVTGVKEVVVIAREDTPGEKRLVAYLVPLVHNESYAEFIRSCKTEIREKLPEYMVPEFVILQKFPRTANGKTDRNALPKPEYNVSEALHDLGPALTSTESMLVSLWETKLGLKRVGINDDFFELGGNSVIAIQVLANLRKETGAKIPLSAMFEYSTVKKLALLVSGSLEKTTKRWKSLVPIKPDGTKNPVYMIHGAGSYVMKFKALAKYLDKDQPVYGLQAIGVNGIDPLVDKIEDIAATYISEMLDHNPAGPYAITGYSFGGLIAHEMARQLKAMNKKVVMVAMLDAYAQQWDHNRSPLRRIWKKADHISRNLLFKLFFAIKDPKEAGGFYVGRILTLLEKGKRFIMGKGNVQANTRNELDAILQKIEDANEVAFRQYSLKPYDGFIDLFRVNKKLYYLKDFKYFGWKPFALQGVNIHNIPGNHFNLFDPPHNKEFAQILQKVLDERNKPQSDTIIRSISSPPREGGAGSAKAGQVSKTTGVVVPW